MLSPSLMTSSLRTRSRTSVSRVPRACRTMPVARVRTSIAEAAASWSVSSWIRADVDDDRLRERAGRPVDDGRGDAVVVVRKARAPDVVELLAKEAVLLER